MSLVKGAVCIHESKVRYNNDTYPKHEFLNVKGIHTDLNELGLDFTGPFCCDRHNNGFDLQKFLPRPLLHSSPTVAPAPLSGQKHPQPDVPNRSTKA